MKKIFSFAVSTVFTVVLMVGIISSASAQWTEAIGPYSSSIYCFASANGNLFAAYQKGVFVSTDNGANWTTYTNAFTNINVTCLAASSDGNGGTNLFAGTGYAGPYLSTDNGKTWIQRFIDVDPSVSSLAISGTKLFQEPIMAPLFRPITA
ncbi:MAG TPA: hypothetical protein VGM92_14410 [Candidatus Kapabacteria bacterium]